MPSDLLISLQQKFPQDIIETHEYRGDEVLVVRREGVLEMVRLLKEDPQFDFNFLMDLTAVDYLKMKKIPRFSVIYHLYSLKNNRRLRLKVPVEEKDPVVDSLTPLYPAADWFEREVWDMFGIRFKGHPNLKRILMYESFVGHPLRKDYPYNKRQPLIGPKN